MYTIKLNHQLMEKKVKASDLQIARAVHHNEILRAPEADLGHKIADSIEASIRALAAPAVVTEER